VLKGREKKSEKKERKRREGNGRRKGLIR